ncbi:uncharacterized protein ANIA_07170 [Aspergillus nidulans FGSC A4]|uniref:BHLH transcription factor (Eurofung) n=1 Tax=Emericella nidulans (strain FGSC A4 / ATCC 38163 / CBS 112.46 / NRRL 194 / M139) TaxID=227321 RepID=C8VD53_EMENI|nr:hypothetical protein [Aspergillus nidulans FGSC A4]CBF78935.1 TPA: putative bHLH transcription factor (Eurofung) [Aspergillus nidulans FGSC A4]
MAYMSPDPLSANWSYDSAIDLFSLNTMIPEPFPLDIPNDMLWDAKELPADFFAAPTDINGFTVSHDESLSSDQESDDQSFSPNNFMASTPPSASTLDLPSPMAMPMNIKTEPQTTINPCSTQSQQPKRKASMISDSSSRYSSPELSPQQPSPPPRQTTTTGRRSRAANATNGDENTARGRNAAKRAAHNIIEKRYRTNMNAKFVALEKAMSVKTSGVSKAVSSTNSSSNGVKSSASLKKSEILSNAITYMQELQEMNERLRKEVAALTRERRANAYC